MASDLFFYNMIGIPLAAGLFVTFTGWKLNPMFGAAAMSLSSVCVVTNALRLNLFKLYDAGKDAEKNKVMKINEQWEELKERSHANIQSERGILKRQTRSIQTEGHFGDIKENENFRRFNYRSADKVYKEFMLYAIGRNINKYHRFLYEKLRKFEGKTA